MNIDREKVLHAAQAGVPLVIKTHRLPPTLEADLEEILEVFLAGLGQEALKDHLIYCLKELTGNAKKANTKRVFFLEKNLRLDVPEEYARGMVAFKSETLGNIQHYLRLQEDQDLYIKITFLIRNNVLHLGVRNNVAITTQELTRVYDRVARAKAFQSVAEAMSEVLDDSEGAGLGIVILILMLRNMGLPEKSFDLSLVGTDTVVTLSIPMNAVKQDNVKQLTQEILQVVDSLPPFPENLQTLLRLLGDPDVSFEDLATHLSQDPALTVDLLKFVNSAQFGMGQKIENLQDAVRIVGIQGLQGLIYPYGAHQILGKYLVKQKSLWQNAARVSFYATELSRTLRFPRETQSQAQIAGILYNLGQIIVSFVHPEVSSRIMGFCQNKGLNIEFFDELTQSINPSELGASIAEKWNFPQDLTQILRFQNHPQGADPALQPVTLVVHLAGSLVSVEQNLLSYGQINAGILRALKLTDPAKLEDEHQRLRAAFAVTGS